jgi:hypothetical protein
MDKLTDITIYDEVNDEYLCNESFHQIRNDISLKMDDFNNKILHMINNFHLLEYDSEFFSNIKTETFEMFDIINLYMQLKIQEVMDNLKMLDLLIEELGPERIEIYNKLRQYKLFIDKITDPINPNDSTDEIKKYLDTIYNKSTDHFIVNCVILVETEFKKKINLPTSVYGVSKSKSNNTNLYFVKPNPKNNISIYTESKNLIQYKPNTIAEKKFKGCSKPKTIAGKIFKDRLKSKYRHICDNILPLVLHVYEQIYGSKLKYHENVQILVSIQTSDEHDISFKSYFLYNENAKIHRIILSGDKITIVYPCSSYICSIEDCARFQEEI